MYDIFERNSWLYVKIKIEKGILLILWVFRVSGGDVFGMLDSFIILGFGRVFKVVLKRMLVVSCVKVELVSLLVKLVD